MLAGLPIFVILASAGGAQRTVFALSIFLARFRSANYARYFGYSTLAAGIPVFRERRARIRGSRNGLRLRQEFRQLAGGKRAAQVVTL